MSKKELEEGCQLQLDYKKLNAIAEKGLDVLPVAVQNVDTKEVILIAYINEAALNHSLQTGNATFWSTSRNELWEKGKTSGETFELIEAYVNCEQNSLVFKVRPRRGDICHTKNKDGKPRNCFYRRIQPSTKTLTNTDP
ncbi:MAG: phosphoribosyl-AMP cyclohydrolase [Deltaproteobacteria bacterium]|nr:phosphoribosyl-AMP cyclohydrolase [Deltaproteobacteria bacterium]